jgi:hypothetical protein
MSSAEGDELPERRLERFFKNFLTNFSLTEDAGFAMIYVEFTQNLRGIYQFFM